VSRPDYEVWLVEKGRRGGKPYTRRHALGVPLNLARGLLEKCSSLQLREAANDIAAERRERGDIE
jgi:hypothetical protein